MLSMQCSGAHAMPHSRSVQYVLAMARNSHDRAEQEPTESHHELLSNSGHYIAKLLSSRTMDLTRDFTNDMRDCTTKEIIHFEYH